MYEELKHLAFDRGIPGTADLGASLWIDDTAGTGIWPAAEWRSEEPNVFPAGSSAPIAWELSVPDAFQDHEARYVDADADLLTVHCGLDAARRRARGCPSPPSRLCGAPPPRDHGGKRRRAPAEAPQGPSAASTGGLDQRPAPHRKTNPPRRR